jgi:transcriptional regulator
MQKAIAKMFKMTESNVSAVKLGKMWASVPAYE